MSDTFDFSWQASDGYVGGSRPQRTRIRMEELEDLDSEDEVREYVEGAVHDDFEMKVVPEWEEHEMELVIQKWREAREGVE